jgi:uncharacterized membrane protein YphA (DoxX/SURF4 family)
MAPLIVMLVIWGGVRVIGLTGWWAKANSTRWALHVALAGMFLFTAISHFHPRTRPGLVQMVPPAFPEPALLVTATGVLELGGAAGLLFPPVARAAAFGLIGFLVAMIPATSAPHSTASSLRDGRRRRWSGVCLCSCSGYGSCGGPPEAADDRRSVPGRWWRRDERSDEYNLVDDKRVCETQ